MHLECCNHQQRTTSIAAFSWVPSPLLRAISVAYLHSNHGTSLGQQHTVNCMRSSVLFTHSNAAFCSARADFNSDSAAAASLASRSACAARCAASISFCFSSSAFCCASAISCARCAALKRASRAVSAQVATTTKTAMVNACTPPVYLSHSLASLLQAEASQLLLRQGPSQSKAPTRNIQSNPNKSHQPTKRKPCRRRSLPPPAAAAGSVFLPPVSLPAPLLHLARPESIAHSMSHARKMYECQTAQKRYNTCNAAACAS